MTNPSPQLSWAHDHVQAEALQTCQHESQILNTPKIPDPFAAQTVYVPVACNDSASTSEQGSALSEAAFKDMKDQIEKLQTTLSRKDELLRVRNNQLVEAYDTLEARAALWNQSVHSAPPQSLLTVPLMIHLDTVCHRLHS